MGGFFKRLPDKTKIAERVASAKKIEAPKEVVALNPGFFTLERMRQRSRNQRVLK